MTARVFVNVRRGKMDATPACVFPWEVKLLEHIHGQDVQEVSIEQMSNIKDGVAKIDKAKFKYSDVPAPTLKQQLEAMVYIDPEEDPATDPATEYNRLAGVYGMDADYPIPVVERIYGQFSGGGFAKMLEEHAKDRMPMPAHLKAVGEGMRKAPEQMNVGELRDQLRERGIKFKVTESAVQLREKLEGALVE